MFLVKMYQDHDVVNEWEFETEEEAQDYKNELEEMLWFAIEEEDEDW